MWTVTDSPIGELRIVESDGAISAIDFRPFAYADGRPRVLGRHVDRFITSAGDWVSPAAVEAMLQSSSFVAAAWLVRSPEGRCACLLSLEEDCVLTYAQRNVIPFTDFSSLAAHPEIHALVQAQIDDLNNTLPAPQHIASFGLLPSDLGDEVLTAALWIRRDVAAARFADRLEALLAA